MKNKPIVVFCTTPDFDCAQNIAQSLVEKNIAACCNIVPGLTSVYSWDNKVQQDNEVLLIIKSVQENFETLKNEIGLLHPYEVPEIISLDIKESSKEYLDWIVISTKGKNEN